MDTTLLEINGIMEAFKIDMLSIEHENFMNIMYSRSEGVVNESVILEGFKETVKKIIKKAKEVIKRLIEKVKEFFDWIKKKLKERKDKIKIDQINKDLENIPDEMEFENVPTLDYLNKCENNIKERYNYLKSALSKINSLNKIEPENMDKIDNSLKDISEYTSELLRLRNEFEEIEEDICIYTGKTLNGSIFIKYCKLEDSFDDMDRSSGLARDILNNLKKADAIIGNFGNKYVYEKGYHGAKNFDYNTTFANPKDIETDDYNDKSHGVNFTHIVNTYITLYSYIVQELLHVSRDSYEVDNEVERFINKVYKYI